ncbi:MAG TPA: hypothetical protein VK337_01920 [Xanthobacteraceae bacterium]|nr:hypothetical protein [Xanthobacteraceae bacterium]
MVDISAAEAVAALTSVAAAAVARTSAVAAAPCISVAALPTSAVAPCVWAARIFMAAGSAVRTFTAAGWGAARA